MKKLIAMVAVLGLASSIAGAQVGNFKYDGKFEFHKFYNNNTSDFDKDAADKKDDQDYRAHIGINFDAGSDANVQIDLIKNSGADTVEFGQAYVAIPDVLKLNHKFGRMFYNAEKGNDIVIYYGPAQWYASDMPYDAFEGWHGEWKNDKMSLGVIIGKEDERTATKTSNKDINIFGATLNFPVNDMFNPTAYVYQRADNTGVINRRNVMGVKATGKVNDNLSYYGEYAMNNGEKTTTVDYKGSALLLGANYKMDIAGNWDFSGEFARGTGDKTGTAAKDEGFYGISAYYNPGILWGGPFGGSDLDDLTTWNVGAKWNLSAIEKLTLSAKLLNFAPTEDKTGYDTYGQELDICAKWQHSENVGLKAYYAMFMIDDDYSKTVFTGKDDLSYQYGIAATVKF